MSSVPLPHHRSLVVRAVLAAVVAALALVGVIVVGSEPAHGQTPSTFPCDGGLYVTTGSPTDMTLTRVDQNTGALSPIGGGGLTANALAHNPADDYLYGMNRNSPHDLVRVHADGTQTSLGPATGAPATWELTQVGAFLENGRYLVLGETVPAGTAPGTAESLWAEIDVSTSTPSVVRTFSHPSVTNSDLWDVAVSPLDGQLYAHSIGRGRVVRIDPSSGTATPVGPVLGNLRRAGSAFFDSFGRLWLYGARTGQTDQDTLFRIDDVFNDGAQIVGTGPAVTNSDGASCPFSVGMEKTAAPATVCAGSTTTFTMTITNESPNGAAITADFLDRLDGGRTFVAGSLVNPFGGRVNAYGGTAELSITDLTLPGNTDAAITVDVAVPADQSPSAFTNQAALLDLSGNVGPAVLSEYPDTPQAPDATPVRVVSCIDLGVTKSTDAPVIGPGDDVTYQVRVTNHGPSDATGVSSLSDAMPAGTAMAAASDGGVATGAGALGWPAFDLAVGQHRDVTVTLTGNADVVDHADADGRIVNVVTVDHPGDTDPANNVARAAIPVARPDLSITKDDGVDELPAGAETTYELVATNHGDGDALGAVLTDTLPEGTTLVAASSGGTESDGVVTWAGIDLDAGESQTMTVTVTLSDGLEADATITNRAEITHDDDVHPADNQATDTDTIIDPDPPQLTRQPDTPKPDPDRPTGFLARTGAELMGWFWVAAAMLGLGGAAWLADNRPRNP